jgi:hypothetical protein
MPGIIREKANTLSYRWEGDLILQDTAVEARQFEIESPHLRIETDIRDWIASASNGIMGDISRKLANEKGLPTTREPGDFDRRAMILWDFVARNVRYAHDSEKNGADIRLHPPEVCTLREGDCEDRSFLLANLLITCGISPFCVRVVLGEVFDENGRSLGGHCWPAYKNESGQWCILESTLDAVPSRMPEADRLTAPGQSFQYKPYYCFNHYHLWKIFTENTIASKTANLERYLRLRDRRVHMKETRLPSGGWLSRLTGDWEPGHREITEHILRTSGFSGSAVDVAGDASQDPDFYDWHTPAAHARTDNNIEGRTVESRDQASGNYIKEMRNLTRKVISSARKDLRAGLFFLGYVLHGIQDLATHRGITSAQHSFMSKMFGKDDDPDHNEANRARARDYSCRYIEFLRDVAPRTLERLAGYSGHSQQFWKLTTAEKARLLNKKGWDMTPQAFLQYSRLKREYARIRSEYSLKSTLWEADAVFERLLKKLRVK